MEAAVCRLSVASVVVTHHSGRWQNLLHGILKYISKPVFPGKPACSRKELRLLTNVLQSSDRPLTRSLTIDRITVS